MLLGTEKSVFTPGNPTVVILRETTGQKRRVRLSGRCLPFKPLSENVTQVVKTTRNPGSPIKTVQVLGFDPTNADWKGCLDTRYMWDKPAFQTDDGSGTWQTIRTAAAARVYLGDICKQGQELVVTYGPEDFSTTARGMLTVVGFDIQNWQIIDFRLHFEWTGDTELVAPPMLTRTVPDTRSWRDKAQALLDAVTDALDMVDGLYEDYVTDTINQVNSLLLSVSDLTQRIEGMAAKPADTARDLAVLAENVVQSVWNIEAGAVATVAAYQGAIARWEGVASTHVEFLPFMRTPSTPDGADSASAEIASVSAALAIDAAARGVVAQARTLKAQALSFIAPEVRDVYQVRPGDTLRSIAAARYNGAVDNWTLIAAFNDLDSDDLTPGMYLLLPEVS